MVDGKKVTAIIVAAGASRRMGFDKLFYPLGVRRCWRTPSRRSTGTR